MCLNFIFSSWNLERVYYVYQFIYVVHWIQTIETLLLIKFLRFLNNSFEKRKLNKNNKLFLGYISQNLLLKIITYKWNCIFKKPFFKVYQEQQNCIERVTPSKTHYLWRPDSFINAKKFFNRHELFRSSTLRICI